jgi:hypothetical protein
MMSDPAADGLCLEVTRRDLADQLGRHPSAFIDRGSREAKAVAYVAQQLDDRGPVAAGRSGNEIPGITAVHDAARAGELGRVGDRVLEDSDQVQDGLEPWGAQLPGGAIERIA